MRTKNKSKRTKRTPSYSVPSQRKIKAILRDLPLEMNFHFYEDVGKPTGQVASSLLDFSSKLASANSPQAQASLTFHMKRGDFATWIRQAIGDSELADKIGEISPNDHNLAERLRGTLDNRIQQLKEAIIEYSIIPEERDATTHVELVY
jgi:hypothetical protein